jgi:hypothetical protein
MSRLVQRSLRWLLSARLIGAIVVVVCVYLGVGHAAQTQNRTGRRGSGESTPVVATPLPRTTPETTRRTQPPGGTNSARRPQRDGDGDGHDSLAFGGDDCDDSDADRYPGNVEVCDAAAHDEDCNPATYGVRDADRDGYPDARCCNRDSNGKFTCGTDCNDGNAVIHPDAQICASDKRAVLVCRPPASGVLNAQPRLDSESAPWERRTCGSGGARCIAQPNGTGICLP